MAIANVSQTCGTLQCSGSALAAPEITVSPLKHSGVAGHRAVATRSAAAGQPALLVAIPNTSAALTAPPARAPGELAPGPAPCGRNRTPITTAAVMITISAAAIPTCRGDDRRRAVPTPPARLGEPVGIAAGPPCRCRADVATRPSYPAVAPRRSTGGMPPWRSD